MRLAVDGGACDIVPVGFDAMARPRGARIAVLTISSLHFRLLIALRFVDDDATRGYFVGANARQPLHEVFMEIANLCCGAMNQALAEHFPDLGMSTPYLLDGASIDALSALEPGHLAAFDVTVGASVRIGATLCVCANGPVDFHVDVHALERENSAVAETAGELEFF
nr:hypothetical protein [Burkholderia guangdongensis]